MRESVASWEEELCAAYRQEVALYSQAALKTRGLPATFAQGEKTLEALQEIAHHLDKVARIEASISKTKSRWLISRGIPGPEFKAVLAQVRRPRPIRLCSLPHSITGSAPCKCGGPTVE
jgi:hypothetical protein